jgi:hypothetical protein
VRRRGFAAGQRGADPHSAVKPSSVRPSPVVSKYGLPIIQTVTQEHQPERKNPHRKRETEQRTKSKGDKEPAKLHGGGQQVRRRNDPQAQHPRMLPRSLVLCKIAGGRAGRPAGIKRPCRFAPPRLSSPRLRSRELLPGPVDRGDDAPAPLGSGSRCTPWQRSWGRRW